MPSKFGTQHHCPGKKVKVGNVSPGDCRKRLLDNGMFLCVKHQIPCRNGCPQFHLLTDPGCYECIGNAMAEDRQQRMEKEERKNVAKKSEEDAFFNPGKDTKKPRK
jgi:hypothetical protein